MMKNILLALGLLVLAVGMSVSVWFWRIQTTQVLGNTPVQQRPEIANDASQTVTTVNVAVTVPTQLPDADADGLTDEEEAQAGTDVKNVDTDGDGLSDREEAKVYGTDPKRTDTDNDGSSDGEEVQSRKNPKGTGDLLDLPSAISELQQ
mgnify:CR=1 FL=1